MKSTKELEQAAKHFIQKYKDKSNEKSSAQSFWIDFLGIFAPSPTEKIEFEKRVSLSHTSFIDAYIPHAKTLIEQKSSGIDLNKAKKQSDGSELTPFEQAKRYNDELPYSQKARYIIVCNFDEFHIHDMESPKDPPQIINFADLTKQIHRFTFLSQSKNDELKALALAKQSELSFKAARLIRQIQDELIALYAAATPSGEPSEQDFASINMLLTRLVFCFYADDSGVFARHDMFGAYLATHKANMRQAILDVFSMLSTPEHKRSKFADPELLAFPYTNGGLFEFYDENIPQFNDKLAELIIDKATFGFDFSLISPTIFGGLFESTLNPETRRSGGMHYTSIENIEKLIKPLFLYKLESELDEIIAIKQKDTKDKKLIEFQKKLGSLCFFDPACGSGNFLTQTFLCLRELENKALKERFTDKSGTFQGVLEGFDTCGICVDINNFYGIEINSFATAVAKTALHIADKQMRKVTNELIHANLEYLPLREFENILCANALDASWHKHCPKADFIIGNPPFIGSSLLDKNQKKDFMELTKNIKNSGKLDYVTAWFFKACEYMKQSPATKTAFVATNSICQGEQVALLWKALFESGVSIDFAYTSFKWDNSVDFGTGKKEKADKKMAAVYVIIAGFSLNNSSQKYIFTGNSRILASNINGYLADAPNIAIESRSKPLCEFVPEMTRGSEPNDGGNLLLSQDEKDEILAKYPNADKFIKQFMGAEEFINGKIRYCLWLVNANPGELSKIPPIMDRIKAVRENRLQSKSEGTRKFADKPTIFKLCRQPKSNYIVIPRVSGENRIYVPIGFVSSDIIASDAIQFIPNATLADFAILTSSVHMEWMRAVAGRLETRYRYSNTIVYNNFPFASLDEKDKETLTATAQGILDARAEFGDSSLADLYNPLTMPANLRKAHEKNDQAVLKIYGIDKTATPSGIVKELFTRYEKLSKNTKG
ncbi:MAG: N-6 DNA methylase [Campylobacter sp.]|uniref:class I SAM-dependent DNA methyltransferase n=2 Tax=Campylobacter sp. TaxID=205 RepID=UPI002AA6FF90|nr:DNA methyltransferase [Campylobacter sp.]MCI6694016.1 N-6 DNA methylase [Campylobacter sp.]